jgi:hypothetical protein
VYDFAASGKAGTTNSILNSNYNFNTIKRGMHEEVETQQKLIVFIVLKLR